MSYIIEYEICGILCIIIIMVNYFRVRHFDSVTNRLFGLMIGTATVVLILDIITAVTIDFVAVIPHWINYNLNTAFYSIQTCLPVIMLLYTMSLAGKLMKCRRMHLLLMFLPALTMIVILLAVNPFTGVFFYIDPTAGYVHGEYFTALHITCGFYMALIMAFINVFRKDMKKVQYLTILCYLIITVAAMVIQYYFPKLLITGPAIALAVTTMYFTLQNPQDMQDVMTKVFNYKAMIQFLKELMDGNRFFHMISVDVNGLKYINRIFGLSYGNQVLIDVGRFLSSVSDEIWVFRMKDTRFVAITCDKKAYEELRGDIISKFDSPWDIQDTKIVLSSVICCMPDLDYGKYTVDQIVNLMEIAISNAEPNGKKGKIFSLDDVLLNELDRTIQIECALNDAIKNGGYFEMYYQPVYSTVRECFVGAEALLRFNHPKLGMLLPAEFIPIAEKNGLALQMDEAVVTMVCDFIKKYDPRNTLKMRYIGINLSAAEFINRQMPEKLTSILDNSKVDPDSILFEITETVANTSNDNVSSCIRQYRDKGYQFALDDFGTGYANLSQVVGLPFLIVKIDHSLAMGQHIVLENLMKMFAQLDLVTVVEGIETKEHLEMLEGTGYDCIQGFYYALPMPADEFVEFIKKENGI
jgi:EAL domain-containing protein (putative c-di-GMP-specific phosphodiesterase class I)/GGDEF domain-containing protein